LISLVFDFIVCAAVPFINFYFIMDIACWPSNSMFASESEMTHNFSEILTLICESVSQPTIIIEKIIGKTIIAFILHLQFFVKYFSGRSFGTIIQNTNRPL